eukprot:2030713-Amphidinium_carterae.1
MLLTSLSGESSLGLAPIEERSPDFVRTWWESPQVVHLHSVSSRGLALRECLQCLAHILWRDDRALHGLTLHGWEFG